jgi:ATP-dependent Lhr-like helicase
LGASVGLHVDPYRILLTLPRVVREKEIEATLRSLSPDGLEDFMRLVLRSSALLKWNLIHSAKKFAALRRGADHRFVSGKAMLERFANTPLVEDAIGRALHDRLDIDGTAGVLCAIAAGQTSIVLQGFSPIGAAGGQRIRELVSPQRADAAILAALQRRLEDTRVLVACLSCRKARTATVREAHPEAGCPHCGGRMLVVVHPKDRDALKLLARKPRGPLEEKRRRQLVTTASLTASHGRRALLALAARGIGPDTAGRLLARQPESDEDLLKDILAAEVLYARTRRFWD